MLGLDRIKKTLKYGVPILLILFILALIGIGTVILPTMDLNQTDNDTNGTLASLAGIGDANSGGGAGGGTPPASTGDDEGCVGECPSVWVEDEPLLKGGFDFFGLMTLPPLVTGHWECEGVCHDKSQLCLFNPTDVMPTGWETSPDLPPDCICIEPKSGGCNFYDANYGIGDQNIKCGGNCLEGSMCMRSTFEFKDVCKCMLPYDSDECGLHYPKQYLGSSTGEFVKPGAITEKDCYGTCTIATLCEFSYLPGVPTDMEIPICYCPDQPEEIPDQEEVVYCEDIKNPWSQKDCEEGFCAVLMYGTKCEFQIDKSGQTSCQCVPLEYEEPTDDKFTDVITDKLFDAFPYKFM